MIDEIKVKIAIWLIDGEWDEAFWLHTDTVDDVYEKFHGLITFDDHDLFEKLTKDKWSEDKSYSSDREEWDTYHFVVIGKEDFLRCKPVDY